MAPEFFESVTFTNGGMVYKHSQPRIAQMIFVTPWVGRQFARLIMRVDPTYSFMRAQLRALWSDNPEFPINATQRDEDIDAMVSFMRWNATARVWSDTISYLTDRLRFEARWHPAIRALGRTIVTNRLRCGFVWGDADRVAPVQIAVTLSDDLNRGACQLRIVGGRGHFPHLEAPDQWVANVALIAHGKHA